MVNSLALDLASTIRHDGDGGVLDTLTSVDGLRLFLADVGLVDVAASDALLLRVVEVRAATRALFARAVEPGPPSRADANRLMPLDDAVAVINRSAALAPVTPVLAWPPSSTMHTVAGVSPDEAVLATLARATIEFLTSPAAADLRACTAPRCVRYFVKGHGRQEFCKPSCSNRARAARHYSRTHAA
ncbi:MAG: CGNR zinc finger domain-containing protein [Hamadaea sp.]|nr:CGNR zinc finger domain-containing protein [Hamadaea sp.]NUR48081.1 CGNR zinc finger domain-containing protein [Hamadaea sp.]NUT05296.1 CGNR zinc finger domain-containing protein [Hamadaea sp.]